MQAGTVTIGSFTGHGGATRAHGSVAVPAMATFVADDGEPLRVWRLGAGRPIILLHGLTCSHRDWSDAARSLATSHEVFAWEARAHGVREASGVAEPTVSRMAQDLANLIEHFGLRNAVLVGHSMGGAVALEYLRQFGSARIGAVCLVDHSPRLIATREWRLGVRGGSLLAKCLRGAAALGADVSGIALRLLGLASKSVPEESDEAAAVRDALARRNVRSLGHMMQSVLAADHRELLARIDVPVFAVFGGASPLYGRVPLARYYASVIANFRSVVYEEAGHSPHREMPGRFVADLLSFIDEAVSRTMHAAMRSA